MNFRMSLLLKKLVWKVEVRKINFHNLINDLICFEVINEHTMLFVVKENDHKLYKLSNIRLF